MTMKHKLCVKRLTPGACPDDAYKVRFPVFLQEQGFSYDVDELDARAYFILLYDGQTPVATGRIVPLDAQCCLFGRIAVRKDYRGGTGRVLVSEMIAYARELGFEQITVHAQTRVVGFYQKLGVVVCGEEYMEEAVPHTPMLLK